MENKSKNNLAADDAMDADKWIEYISDKYGVSKQRIMLLMSALPKDRDAIEAVLKRERFVR